MSFVTVFRTKFVVLVAVLALLAVLALGALASMQCDSIDDYGNCVGWSGPTTDGSDLIEGLGG